MCGKSIIELKPPTGFLICDARFEKGEKISKGIMMCILTNMVTAVTVPAVPFSLHADSKTIRANYTGLNIFSVYFKIFAPIISWGDSGHLLVHELIFSNGGYTYL